MKDFLAKEEMVKFPAELEEAVVVRRAQRRWRQWARAQPQL